jgi:hypothetical protein
MGEDLKAIQDTLRGIRGWCVVLEGKAAGVWTGVKPLAALKLIKNKRKRMPPHEKAKNLAEALEIWFRRHKTPPVVGVGRDLILRPGAKEYQALAAFFPQGAGPVEREAQTAEK